MDSHHPRERFLGDQPILPQVLAFDHRASLYYLILLIGRAALAAGAFSL